ncbi:hypothetical protein [Actinokineospora terrae]|uniref:Uncharacterized protein n=1 Tax=Actinokineospora terrae TaxID=155974 RepID=A0A1H9M9H7_9PSEU|nr:hypothetical protein [Actinokineospora terrae]SER20119.1 hypothetical protein SAMN04487818_10230 [Actinokineospora terrae]
MLTFRGSALAAGAVLLAAAVAACSTPIPGTALPQPPPDAAATGAVPSGRTPVTAPSRPGSRTPEPQVAPGIAAMPGQADKVAAYPLMRRIDPCALHDPAAAARVTGARPDELVPGRHLNACELVLSAGDTAVRLPTWRLTATVGADRGQRVAPEVIAGIEFTEIPPASTAEQGRSCRMVRGFGPTTALELLVRHEATAPAPQTPCAVARAYLAEAGKWWDAPALRADKLTTPTLRIADLDPCAGLTSVASELGQGVRASLPHPHGCSLLATKGEPGQPGAGKGARLTVELGMAIDPRALLDNATPGYVAVTVAGRPGVSTRRPAAAGSTCELAVVADDTVTVRADQTRDGARAAVQVVTVSAAECPLAVRAADGVLALIR